MRSLITPPKHGFVQIRTIHWKTNEILSRWCPFSLDEYSKIDYVTPWLYVVVGDRNVVYFVCDQNCLRLQIRMYFCRQNEYSNQLHFIWNKTMFGCDRFAFCLMHNQLPFFGILCHWCERIRLQIHLVTKWVYYYYRRTTDGKNKFSIWNGLRRNRLDTPFNHFDWANKNNSMRPKCI